MGPSQLDKATAVACQDIKTAHTQQIVNADQELAELYHAQLAGHGLTLAPLEQ